MEPNIPLKIKDLLGYTKKWKKVVTDIETEVMPLYSEYNRVIHVPIMPPLAQYYPSILPPSQPQASGSSLLPSNIPSLIPQDAVQIFFLKFRRKQT